MVGRVFREWPLWVAVLTRVCFGRWASCRLLFYPGKHLVTPNNTMPSLTLLAVRVHHVAHAGDGGPLATTVASPLLLGVERGVQPSGG